MTLAIAILGLALLILVHEAGHFFTARAVGMRPRRFYVGFPPALVKVRRNGIEYGLGAIPLGGYVKIPGMHRPAPSDVDVLFGRAVEEAPELLPPAERLKRSLADADVRAAQAALPDVEAAVSEARLSPPAAAAAERGVRDLGDSLSPDAYWRQPVWKRIAVIFAGPGTNLLFAVILFAVLFVIGGGEVTRSVDNVLPDRPAAAAGLQPGDRILAIDGRLVEPREISREISESQGRALTLTVERGGRAVTIGPVRARRNGSVFQLGFQLERAEVAPGEAVWRSLELTALVTREIGASLARLVRGEGREDIASPVGIVQGSSTALEESTETYLWVLGLISLSLALLNLLPLLPLDGGHITFSLVEALRGRAVKREVYERVSALGIALVVLLFFVGLSNDIGRI